MRDDCDKYLFLITLLMVTWIYKSQGTLIANKAINKHKNNN